MRDHSHLMAEIDKAMKTDGSDVRIVYCVRAQAIVLETRHANNEFTEVLRQELGSLPKGDNQCSPCPTIN
jgi:hypothetical protein